MRFRVLATGQGLTVFDAQAGETYKSRHSVGAETQNVFYRPGVLENPWRALARPFRVLELGFGLGTNFLHLAAREGAALELVSVERDLSGARFFLGQEESEPLREILSTGAYRRGFFSARIEEGDFFACLPALARAGEKFHAVYFDPFSPKSNPEAWTVNLFSLCHSLLYPGGRLVTYSVSRPAKDAAAAAGFAIQKHKLPPALQKRSALLAVKAGGP